MAMERRRDDLGGGQGDDGPTLTDQINAQVARAIREREARDRAARERAAQDRAPRDDQDTTDTSQDTADGTPGAADGTPAGTARPDTAAAISLSSLTTFGRPASAAGDDGDDDAPTRGDSGRRTR